jgi:hypothetical protein
MDSAQHVQVGVPRKHPPISPLSLWERVRVRGFSILRTPKKSAHKLSAAPPHTYPCCCHQTNG